MYVLVMEYPDGFVEAYGPFDTEEDAKYYGIDNAPIGVPYHAVEVLRPKG